MKKVVNNTPVKVSGTYIRRARQWLVMAMMMMTATTNALKVVGVVVLEREMVQE